MGIIFLCCVMLQVLRKGVFWVRYFGKIHGLIPWGNTKKMSCANGAHHWVGRSPKGDALCSGEISLPFPRLQLPPWQGEENPSDLPCVVFANVLGQQFHDKTLLEGGWLSSLGFLTRISDPVWDGDPGCARGARAPCVLPGALLARNTMPEGKP